MTTRDLALAAHLLGVIFWIGGMVTAATVAAVGHGDKTTLKAARRAVVQWATPGLLVAWGGGLTLLIPDFTELYARAGWMHAKLTVLLVLSGVTGVLAARLRKAAAGTRPASGGLFDGLGYGLAIGAVIVLLLAVLKPF